LNSGATLTKLSQNGKNPRPADLGQADRPTTMRFDLAVVRFMILSTKTSQLKGGSSKIHKLRSKGLNQVKMGSILITNQRIKTQPDLRSSVHLVNNVPVRKRPEPSQSQADRPRRGQPASNYLRWSHVTATDLRKQSQTSTQRRWPDGRVLRPAGLGEASRPHSAVSRASASRGRQAHRLYLRVTNAKSSSDLEAV
jgi:hypothetical protein